MNLRTRVLLTGGILGALIGVLAGWLYYNSVPVQVDEKGRETIAPPTASHALKLGLGILGILRQIAG